MGAIRGGEAGSASDSHYPIESKNSDDIRMQHRQSWLDFIKNHTNQSKKEVRQMNQTLYAWLYRHDWAWLLNQTITKPLAQSPKPRVDWNTRDQQMVVLVQKAVR
jgi:hypothetical protein